MLARTSARQRCLLFVFAALSGMWTPAFAAAFGGFLVAKHDQPLRSDAAMVALMRDGQHTVQSIQLHYAGPQQDFAIVIPVHGVVHTETVRTLPQEVFQHLDVASAPRLTEYEERDPCGEWRLYGPWAEAAATGAWDRKVDASPARAASRYAVTALSGLESARIDVWLREQGYVVPERASALLAPYVAAHFQFLIARFEASALELVDGQARLPPLRFEYDAERLGLPLGPEQLTAADEYDLVVAILAPERYQAARRTNAIVPTAVALRVPAREQFPGVYEAIFRRVHARQPAAVVTEHANYPWWNPRVWPSEDLRDLDFGTLGGDSMQALGKRRLEHYTLTRLHLRGAAAASGELVLEPAARVDPPGDRPRETCARLFAPASSSRHTRSLRAGPESSRASIPCATSRTRCIRWASPE